MKEWLRRVDPAFYRKEPDLLRTQAQIPRYTDEAQAEVRLGVLRADRLLHVATTIVALGGYVAAIGGGTLVVRAGLPTVWAFAVLAVAGPRALPWWPPKDGRATWRHALIGIVLVALPAVGSRFDPLVFGVAMLAGATLFIARGRGRVALLALAVGVLVGTRVVEHPFVLGPLAGAAAAGAFLAGMRGIAGVCRLRTQAVTWLAFAVLLIVCAYTFAFDAPFAALRQPAEIAGMASAYLGVCIMAARVRRAELAARPEGVLSLPQSIVPLLDRSHHHAIICWLA